MTLYNGDESSDDSCVLWMNENIRLVKEEKKNFIEIFFFFWRDFPCKITIVKTE